MLKNSMMILMIMLIASGDHDNSDVKDLTLDKHTDMQKAYKFNHYCTCWLKKLSQKTCKSDKIAQLVEK